MLYNDEPGKYGSYVVQDLRAPVTGDAAFQEMYKKFSHRILWMDGNVVPGAFQMNTAWYYAVPERDPVFPGHTHPAIDGEARRLTRSTLVFIPGGVPHMPMRILRVDKPVFHFSIMRGDSYNGGAYK